MKRSIAIILLLCACDEKSLEPATCLDYATALLSQCLYSVKESEHSELQCDSGLLEAGYNACNLSLESGQSVCIPYASIYGGCRDYVQPPVPQNWRGTPSAEDVGRGEREP